MRKKTPSDYGDGAAFGAPGRTDPGVEYKQGVGFNAYCAGAAARRGDKERTVS